MLYYLLRTPPVPHSSQAYFWHDCWVLGCAGIGPFVTICRNTRRRGVRCLTGESSMEGFSTTIVVPCYNEASRLDVGGFLRFANTAPAVQFIMVNDGSTDATQSILARLCSANPARFEQIDLPHNCGKAEAVRQGLQRALSSRAECVGFWDADLATPLEAIAGFRQVLSTRRDIDIVLGSRIPLLGHNIERHPARALIGRTFARAASAVLGLGVYDTQCGAKLFRASHELAVALARPFLSRWIFDVELIARLATIRATPAALRRSIYELPLDVWREQPGSKLRARHFALAAVELLQIRWSYSGARARRYAASLPPVSIDEGEEPYVSVRAA